MYRLPNIVKLIKSRRLRRADYVARMEEGEIYSKILTVIPKGKRRLRRPWRRWEDIISIDLKDIQGVSTRGTWLIRLTIEIMCEPL